MRIENGVSAKHGLTTTLPPDDRFVAQSQAAIERALAKLDEETVASIPADAAEFALHLQTSLSQAATQLADAPDATPSAQLTTAIAILETNLNFDSYPGTDRFSALAKANGCRL